jgi:hypothetical protein
MYDYGPHDSSCNNNNKAGYFIGMRRLWLVIKIKIIQYEAVCPSYRVYKRGLPQITLSVPLTVCIVMFMGLLF